MFRISCLVELLNSVTFKTFGKGDCTYLGNQVHCTWWTAIHQPLRKPQEDHRIAVCWDGDYDCQLPSCSVVTASKQEHHYWRNNPCNINQEVWHNGPAAVRTWSVSRRVWGNLPDTATIVQDKGMVMAIYTQTHWVTEQSLCPRAVNHANQKQQRIDTRAVSRIQWKRNTI